MTNSLRYTTFPDLSGSISLENEGTWSAFIAGHPLRCYAVELNYCGRLTMTDVCETFRMFGLRAAFYSITEDAPNWRAILPLSSPHAPIANYRLAAMGERRLGGILDPASFTLLQAVFYGEIKVSEHECIASEGVCIDQADFLEAGSISRSDGESAITEIVGEGGVGISKYVICSSYLSGALRASDMGIDLKTTAVSNALKRTGYTKIPKRQHWNGKPHWIWVKGLAPVWGFQMKALLDASVPHSQADFPD